MQQPIYDGSSSGHQSDNLKDWDCYDAQLDIHSRPNNLSQTKNVGLSNYMMKYNSLATVNLTTYHMYNMKAKRRNTKCITPRQGKSSIN